MNKLDELMALLQKQEKEEEKCKNTVMWILAIIGAVAAVAGIAYAVYRFFTPDYLEDFEDDFDDDFDDYYDDDNRDYGLAAPERAERQERPRHERAPKPERQERPRSRGRDDKVVNIHTTTQLQVVLVKPERFEEAASIGDNLNAKRTVVLNLESTNRDIARRLLDFLSGVAYANNGQIKRVANSTYIITPYNVDVMGDLIDELENNGMFM